MFCPFITSTYRRNCEDVSMPEQCGENRCALWDKTNKCCGLNITPFINLLANVVRK